MKELTTNNFSTEIINKKGIAIVDFMAEWCAPCQTLKPILNDLSADINDVDFCTVDIDKNIDLAKKYGVYSVPTMIFFKNGENIRQISGLRSKSQLKDIIEQMRKL